MTRYADMHAFLFLVLVCFSIATSGSCQPRTPINKQDDQPRVVKFAGTTPCDAFVRKTTNIPDTIDCDKIKWVLTLFQDPDSDTLKKFSLQYTYGMQEQNGPGFEAGGQERNIQGHWKIVHGAPSDPTADIYQLFAGQNLPSILLLKINDQILHFLFSDKNLLIGNAGFGYALHRINQ